MSNIVTTACRPLQLPPAQKAVLMCIADYAHDDGRDWHSVAAIMAWTCLGRSTVLEAIRRLAAEPHLLSVKQTGRNNLFQIDLNGVRDTTREVQQPDIRGPAAGHLTKPPEVQQLDIRGPAAVAEVQQLDIRGPAAGPEASEASKASNKHQGRARERARPTPAELFPDVDQQVLNDWLQVRKDARAKTLTETAAKGIRREAAKLDITAEHAIRLCTENGWQGINANWDSVKAALGKPCVSPVTARQRAILARTGRFAEPDYYGAKV